MRRFVIGVAMASLGCAHGNANYAEAAIAAIVLVGAVSTNGNIHAGPANGGVSACLATCAPGTVCDEHGLCRPPPCHNGCGDAEECIMVPEEHCEPMVKPEARVEVLDGRASSGGHGDTVRNTRDEPPPPSPAPEPRRDDSREQR